jgi:hypothetical protein
VPGAVVVCPRWSQCSGTSGIFVVITVRLEGNFGGLSTEPGGAAIFGSVGREKLQRAHMMGASPEELVFLPFGRAPPKTAPGAAAKALPNGP